MGEEAENVHAILLPEFREPPMQPGCQAPGKRLRVEKPERLELPRRPALASALLREWKRFVPPRALCLPLAAVLVLASLVPTSHAAAQSVFRLPAQSRAPIGVAPQAGHREPAAEAAGQAVALPA